MYFDMLIRLGVDNKCDVTSEQMSERQTERPLAVARSNVVRRTLAH